MLWQVSLCALIAASGHTGSWTLQASMECKSSMKGAVKSVFPHCWLQRGFLTTSPLIRLCHFDLSGVPSAFAPVGYLRGEE
jgi:hypothetical protein